MPIFGAVIPFADHCGIEEVDISETRTLVRVRLAPHHLNHLGIVHGGLTCTLLDVALGTSARTRAGGAVMTLDMQVAFVGAGRRTLVAEGRVVRAGRSVLFCEAEVRHEDDGSLVAKGSGIFMPAKAKRAA